MTRFLAYLALTALVIGGSASPVVALCKEQCVKHCMGNDTPTERAECLKRDKCDNEPVCPADTGSGSGGTKFDPGGGSPPPSTFGQRFTLPPTGGVLMGQ